MSVKYPFVLLLMSVATSTMAQTPIRKFTAVRTEEAPDIDGNLNDAVWKNAPIATDFVELKPKPGRHEDEAHRTEIKLLYDNTAIYVSARMYELSADSVARELVSRDQIGNSDFIGVVFDTYLDKINGNGFYVTAAGVQFDAKYSSSGNEDAAWNAVWFSKVKVDDKGWSAEMKIPYSALRFSKKDVQTWGLNMIRKRQFFQKQLFWSPLDPQKSGFVNQGGELSGIADVEPPIRLSFSPYVSSYVNHYPYNVLGVKNTTGSFNGGMDVKYGINAGFTLDMTLVPDFGQVQSDNQILNLTPFETQFNENRSFFTEGTELFNKGDLFYSRRVGSQPLNYGAVQDQLAANEHIVKNPLESRLVNATKISGRTQKGLGIGFFNAVTRRMDAIVEDDKGNRRFIETQPLTNYNILVLDQSLKNNSYVSFINTSVLRKGTSYDANASAFVFGLNDKKNEYYVRGAAKASYLSNASPSDPGYSYDWQLGRQSGKFVFSLSQQLTDDRFEINDLGILFNNNFLDHSLNVGYNVYKPGKWYNQFETWTELDYSQRFRPSSYQSFGVYSGAWVQFKNFNSMSVNYDYQPEANDFYEPRVAGKVFRVSATQGYGVNFNSNRAKKYNAGFNLFYRRKALFNGRGYSYYIYQNFRLSNKLALGNDLSYDPRNNEAGYTANSGGNVIFARRDRKTIENSIDAKYTFSNTMGITFRARHYWSNLDNKQFYTLESNGGLTPNSSYVNSTANRTFNTFNIDMVYSWIFSQGSELSIVYKDASSEDQRFARPGYFGNFGRVMDAPQNNSLSVKLLYYIDYLNFRKKH